MLRPSTPSSGQRIRPSRADWLIAGVLIALTLAMMARLDQFVFSRPSATVLVPDHSRLARDCGRG